MDSVTKVDPKVLERHSWEMYALLVRCRAVYRVAVQRHPGEKAPSLLADINEKIREIEDESNG